jgi:PAS domain S-box-containing protein
VDDDGRSRRELVAELEELRKRLTRLETSHDAELLEELEAAQQDGARLNRLLSQGTDLICEVGEDGEILYMSSNAETIIGRPASEAIGRSVTDSELLRGVHPEDRGALIAYLGDGLSRVSKTEHLYRVRVDGKWRSIAIRGRSTRGPDGRLSAVIFGRDVTDREEAVKALRDSEARHRLLIEATHDLVAEVDAEGRVVFVSPSCEKVLGLRPEEMIGTTPFSLLHPDDVEHLAELFIGRVHASHAPRSGRTFRIRHRDGSWRWLEGTGINFETAEGATHVVAVTRDVTERIEAERAQERLMQRVAQARRFESLGMLATGMAHDFNNLLTPILGAAGLALMDLPADSPARPRLERIQRTSSEAAALTNQLLEYAGMGGFDAERVNMPTVIAGVEDPLRGAVGRRAALCIEHESEQPLIEADATQLGQLVLHVVSNAVDAIEEAGGDSGSVVLRTGSGLLDDATLARVPIGEDCDPGPYAWLEVEDDGAGMDDATRARIFDPFFTTKLSGRGLGLSVVQGVVRKHRGAIELDSEKGRGTRMRIWFPTA